MEFPLPELPAFKKTRIDFLPEEFRAAIFQKGQPLLWSQAVSCPCSAETAQLNIDLTNFDSESVSASPTVACPACNGAGKLFHSPQLIKALISSAETDFINARFGGFKDGVVSITVNPEHTPSAGDRFVLQDAIMLFNEVLVYSSSTPFKTTFPIAHRDMTLASGDITLAVPYMVYAAPPSLLTNVNQTLVEGTDFTVQNGMVTWINPPPTGSRISISYYMHPSYTAISFPKTVRDSRSKRKSPEEYHIPLPVAFHAKLEFLGGE
jgi:hypothetical protein